MPYAPDDPDWRVATDPNAASHVLAEIAGRRWDLRGVIATNPQADASLLQWISFVTPGGTPPPAGFSAAAYPASQPMVPAPAPSYPTSAYPASSYPTAASRFPDSRFPDSPYLASPYGPPQRRRGMGRWFVGCGCLSIVGVLALVLLGAAINVAVDDTRPVSSSREPVQTGQPATSSVVDEQLKIFARERAAYDALAAELDGNPVAPLVLSDQEFVEQLDREAAATDVPESMARSIATRMKDFRIALEDKVAAAEIRMTNISGTVTEQLIDEAGAGFIELKWDALTACDEPGRTIAACVWTNTPLVVHHVGEASLKSEWAARMTVIHELAHVYQAVDQAVAGSGTSTTDRLLAQGYFDGDSEAMADCYSMTYWNEWSPTSHGSSPGFWYVCDAAERQVIRDWAAELNLPMPG